MKIAIIYDNERICYIEQIEDLAEIKKENLRVEMVNLEEKQEIGIKNIINGELNYTIIEKPKTLIEQIEDLEMLLLESEGLI